MKYRFTGAGANKSVSNRSIGYSMRYEFGKVYNLVMWVDQRHKWLWVKPTGISRALPCPYESIEKFLENWEEVK